MQPVLPSFWRTKSGLLKGASNPLNQWNPNGSADPHFASRDCDYGNDDHWGGTIRIYDWVNLALIGLNVLALGDSMYEEDQGIWYDETEEYDSRS